MAIEPQFISENGPFVGTSCLPWRQRDRSGPGGVRCALAINVDFSRGTIRPRRGFSAFSGKPAWPGSARVMGLAGYQKSNGQSLVIAIVMKTFATANTAYPWTLEFQVYDSNGGTALSTTRIDQHPFYETPDPDNWYSMCQFNDKLFIASRRGKTMQYDFDVDAEKPEYSTGKVLASMAAAVKMFTTFPQGSILVEHDGRMVVAGFQNERHILNERVEDSQFAIDDERIDLTRVSVNFRPNELIISETVTPNSFAFDRIIPFSSDTAVRGLASTGAGLLVITDSNVYSLQISPANQEVVAGPKQQTRLLVEGIGCVGQRTVVQGRGLTAWMGHDGVYLHDGQSVRSISDDIADLWSAGRWREGPIFAMGDIAASLGYPFVLQKGCMERACGAFDPSTSTFLWAVPSAATRTTTALSSHITCLRNPGRCLRRLLPWCMGVPLRGRLHSGRPTLPQSMTGESSGYCFPTSTPGFMDTTNRLTIRTRTLALTTALGAPYRQKPTYCGCTRGRSMTSVPELCLLHGRCKFDRRQSSQTTGAIGT